MAAHTAKDVREEKPSSIARGSEKLYPLWKPVVWWLLRKLSISLPRVLLYHSWAYTQSTLHPTSEILNPVIQTTTERKGGRV